MSSSITETICVVGLGYVGLPVAVAFSRRLPTIGFDINQRRVTELRDGVDVTGEVESADLERATLRLTSDPADLAEATFYIVAVPTPIDKNSRPDLSPLLSASRSIAPYLCKGDVVVYESTVFPGVTEDVCGPVLEEASGLTRGVDFFLGYSPERINPGDKVHTFESIVKIVSGQNAATLDRVAAVYETVVEAGVHRAPQIKVAEAAKVIENTQRDLNIALMNELAFMFDRMDIRTKDVLEAAGTKWNFLPFSPGLVGGHCIGVDPYYLTEKAQELGYYPQVVLAGRRVNTAVGAFIAQSTLKMLRSHDMSPSNARVGVLGLTFKENVPDLRNSRVPDIVAELQAFGVKPLVHDPMCDAAEAEAEYGFVLSDWDQLTDLDAVIYAVGHQFYADLPVADLLARLRPNGVLIDVKSLIEPAELPDGMQYWSL